MRDGPEPWRTRDLVDLEREINYWTGPAGYAACTAGVRDALLLAAAHGMDRVAVLPAWSARHDGDLRDVVARISPSGRVIDCDGAEIVVMPAEESLDQFVAWCRRNVRWT